MSDTAAYANEKMLYFNVLLHFIIIRPKICLALCQGGGIHSVHWFLSESVRRFSGRLHIVKST